MPLGKVHELTFLWFGLPGPLLKNGTCTAQNNGQLVVVVSGLRSQELQRQISLRVSMTEKHVMEVFSNCSYRKTGLRIIFHQERRRHTNINLFGRWPLRWPGGLPTGRPGVQDLCAILGTQKTQIFWSGYPTGRTGDRGDRTKFYVLKFFFFLCAFSVPYSRAFSTYYWGQNDYMPKKLFWAINFWIASHYRTSVFVCPD